MTTLHASATQATDTTPFSRRLSIVSNAFTATRVRRCHLNFPPFDFIRSLLATAL